MHDMNALVGSCDFLFITLDTLRHDIAQREFAAGRTPFFQSLFPAGWEKRHAPGSFTWSSHCAFFAGFLPTPAEPGTHERWFPLYKRILDAGKSVQILGGSTATFEPVLQAIGSKGVYIYGSNNTIEEIEAAARLGDRWRRG